MNVERHGFLVFFEIGGKYIGAEVPARGGWRSLFRAQDRRAFTD